MKKTKILFTTINLIFGKTKRTMEILAIISLVLSIITITFINNIWLQLKMDNDRLKGENLNLIRLLRYQQKHNK